MGKSENRSANRLGKVNGKRKDERRLEGSLVLPDRAGEIIPSQVATNLQLRINRDQVDGDAFESMIAVDVSDIQSVIRYLANYINGLASENDSLPSCEV